MGDLGFEPRTEFVNYLAMQVTVNCYPDAPVYQTGVFTHNLVLRLLSATIHVSPLIVLANIRKFFILPNKNNKKDQQINVDLLFIFYYLPELNRVTYSSGVFTPTALVISVPESSSKITHGKFRTL